MYFDSRRSAVLATNGMVATSQPLATMAGWQALWAAGTMDGIESDFPTKGYSDDQPKNIRKGDRGQRLRASGAVAHRDDVLIAGAGYLRGEPDDESKRFVPDCVVAFGVNPNAIIARNGYVISEVGWPPDFVLEVASRSTGRRDYTVKRDGYAEYGVREYWRFDHSGGRCHDAPLAGDVLTGETYTPLPIHREPDGLLWGHSEVRLGWRHFTIRRPAL